MIEQEIMDTILKEYIAIDKNSHFIASIFIDPQTYFLDIKFNKPETGAFYKTTHTGQYGDLPGRTT